MKFFMDNCLPAKMARAFSELTQPNHSFTHLTEKLHRGCTDEEWLKHLAKEGEWVFLTKDFNITKKPVEKAALAAANMTGFFLDKSWRNLDFWRITSHLTAQMPNIIQLALDSPPGSCFKVGAKPNRIQKL